MDKLKNWSINRKNTEALRNSVITHMNAVYGENGIELLPPIYSMDINELSDEDLRLLDNLNEVFFKGNVVGAKLF